MHESNKELEAQRSQRTQEITKAAATFIKFCTFLLITGNFSLYAEAAEHSAQELRKYTDASQADNTNLLTIPAAGENESWSWLLSLPTNGYFRLGLNGIKTRDLVRLMQTIDRTEQKKHLSEFVVALISTYLTRESTSQNAIQKIA